MVRKRSRSSSGTASSAACASTRRLNARMPSSRLRNCAGREILRFIDGRERPILPCPDASDDIVTVRNRRSSANLAPMARHDTLAAVDLGSNSFHLQIGRVVDGQIYPLDAVREVVRLGGGLTAEKRIDRATQAARARGARQVRRAAARLPAAGGARGRHQRAARGEELAAVPARGARRARLPDRGDLRPRGSAPDLPRRGALAAAHRRNGAWWSTSAAARPSSSSAPASSRCSPSRCTWAASATA